MNVSNQQQTPLALSQDMLQQCHIQSAFKLVSRNQPQNLQNQQRPPSFLPGNTMQQDGGGFSSNEQLAPTLQQRPLQSQSPMVGSLYQQVKKVIFSPRSGQIFVKVRLPKR